MTSTGESEFVVGDLVEWTSQSAGITKTKRGKVIEVVPSETIPQKLRGSGFGRDHTSYVISAKKVFRDGSLDKRSRRYWPRVKYLRRVEE